MQIEPIAFGVSARFQHRCGHQSAPLFFAAEQFASTARQDLERQPCWSCHNSIELQLGAVRREEARRIYSPRPVPVPDEKSDPGLPRKGDFYVNAEAVIVRVERAEDGSYWLRRTPDKGIVYQTWVRDQGALMEFFEQRGFVLLRRDLH